MEEVTPIKKAFNIANKAGLTRDELEDLQKREIYIHDQKNAIIKGEKRGIKKGIELGAKEKALEIAKKLIGVLDDETISKTTGLSLEEITLLKTNLNN